MDPEKKPRMVRIISGTPEWVDMEVNALLGEYALQTLNYAVARDQVVVTAYLVHQSEIRKMQLLAMHVQPNNRR